MSSRRFWLRAILAVVLVVVVIIVVAWSRGSVAVIDVAARPASADVALTRRICLAGEPRRDRELLERCVRLRGELLWIRRERDDAGAVNDVHLLVAAHFHLYIVKVHPPFEQDLRRGRSLTAVGALVKPHPSRFGIEEVDAFYLSRNPPTAP